MGRLLLVLAAACLVATFVMVWKIPFDPLKIYSSPRKVAETAQPAKDSASKEKADAQRAVSGKRKARAGSSRASSVTDTKESNPEAETEPAPDVEQDDSQAKVKSSSAPVYSANSPESAILKLLRKGDKVETDLEVIDTEGRWSLIKGTEEKRSGYVRSEDLETKQPSKRKPRKSH